MSKPDVWTIWMLRAFVIAFFLWVFAQFVYIWFALALGAMAFAISTVYAFLRLDPFYDPERDLCVACGHLSMHHDHPGGTCIMVMPGALSDDGRFPECPCPDFSPGIPPLHKEES